MNFPTEIRINGKTWQIVLLREVDAPEISADGAYVDHTWGYCDAANRRLEILKRLGKKNRLLTAIHEALHACEAELAFELPHAKLDEIAKVLVQLIGAKT